MGIRNKIPQRLEKKYICCQIVWRFPLRNGERSSRLWWLLPVLAGAAETPGWCLLVGMIGQNRPYHSHSTKRVSDRTMILFLFEVFGSSAYLHLAHRGQQSLAPILVRNGSMGTSLPGNSTQMPIDFPLSLVPPIAWSVQSQGVSQGQYIPEGLAQKMDNPRHPPSSNYQLCSSHTDKFT